MTTVLEDADEGSSRASCVFMARSYTGQVLVRNPSAKSVHISASYARLSQKTGHVLVRTPGTRKPGFQPQKRAMSGGLKLGRQAHLDTGFDPTYTSWKDSPMRFQSSACG